MAETLGAWLRQQREARSWTRREMARQLIQAGRDTGDTTVPGMDSMCHNIHRWERGRGGSHRTLQAALLQGLRYPARPVRHRRRSQSLARPGTAILGDSGNPGRP